MARDILGDYGKDVPHSQAPRATNGGQVPCKELDYQKPVGPTGQMREGPGLGGTNYGNNGTQGKR